MECWNGDRECMDREEIAQLQLERLQSTLHRVYKNVRHYRRTFREIDFMPEDLHSLEQFRALPFTDRKVLEENYPYGMFAVSLREVVRLHTPAINVDHPVVMGFTQNDLDTWAELMARNLAAVGVDRDDVVQISLTFGILTGPFGVQIGAERIGASVIPMSSGKYPSQVKIMRDFKTTTLVSTPTFALGLIRAMDEMGVDPKCLSLKYGLFGSEPWSERTRARIEEKLHVTATDTYGLAEVFGPGVAWECGEKAGLHIPEDHFFPEIIDPETAEPLQPGETGELVLTTLTKEAFPLIRYRTGDITRLDLSTCACGRSHCRIARMNQRSDDVIVMRGTRILPDQIGRILEREARAMPRHQILVERRDDQDYLTVLIEISDQFFFDEMKKQRSFVETLQRRISEFLGWEAGVRLVEAGAFDPAVRVADRRDLE